MPTMKYFFGKIEGIEDLISFEGISVAELKESFEKAVEEEVTRETADLK